MIGKQLLNYEIKSLIGEGGMGNVYLGEHVSIGRKVAIKVLRPELASNDEIRSRFKNEASVMAHLQHPGIVGLIDYLEQEDGLYLIMEYVEGIEFTDLLKTLTEPLSIDRAKDIMKKVLSAFAYAHKNKIVHRDVKPSNILLTKDDEVKVLDFGIAKLVGDSQFNLTKTGTQVGTVYYMSPEQVKAKELDHRSDIYSLGITFYELLAGFCPYKSMTSEYEVYDKIVREPLLPLTDTMGDEYAQVWSVIEKATEKEAADRFQSCDEFITALDTQVSKPKLEKSFVDPKKQAKIDAAPVPKPKKSMAWLYIVIGMIIIVAVVGVVNFGGGEDVRDDSIDVTEENSTEYEQQSDNEVEQEAEGEPAELAEPNWKSEVVTEETQKESNDEISVPFYIINTAAVKKEDAAEKKVLELKQEGYKADYLWIPDYASLSGAEYFSVYIGPFKTKQECAIALDQYQIENPKAYGTLVSHNAQREVVHGLTDAVQ